MVTPASDHRFYMPIIRWKAAEKHALSKLFCHGTDTSRLMPLISVLPKYFEEATSGVVRAVDKIAKDLNDHWGRQQPVYLDMESIPSKLCTEAGTHALALLEQVAFGRYSFIPVIGLNPSPEYLGAVMEVIDAANRGNSLQGASICLRLSAESLSNSGIEREVQEALRRLLVDPDSVDLLVDAGYIAGRPVDYARICRTIPLDSIRKR